MIKPKFKNRGMVRAVVVVSLTGSNCTSSISREDAEKYDNIWAVGVWHRDDEKDLESNLERDFAILHHAYSELAGNDFSGCVFTYEYRDYRR